MKPEHCLGCPLYEAPGPVPGYGPENAKIFFIGEAPGNDEVRYSKRPFTGPSGRMLRGIIDKLGIAPNTVYMSNTVRCRPTAISPSTGKEIDRAPSKEEIAHCGKFLAEEIGNVNPNLIVTLGNSALYALNDTNDIGKWRGVPFVRSGRKVLATYHPAGIMRQQHMFPAFYHDLKKVTLQAQSPTLHVLPVDYQPNGDVAAHRESILAAARRLGYVCIDIETAGNFGGLKGALDPSTGQVICYGVGSEPQRATCFMWTDESRQLLSELLADPGIEKIGQNSENFDWVFLEGKGCPYPVGERFDTLQAFHLCGPDLPKNLATIATFYTDMPYWKSEAKTGDLRVYNCKDVDATMRAAHGLKNELASMNMGKLYARVSKLQPVLRTMTKRGFRKDELLAAKYSVLLNNRANEKEAVLQSALGHTFNVNSAPQVIDLLYNKLGLPKQYLKTKDGFRLTANDEAMEHLALITDNPVFLQVNSIRSLRKGASTYCDIETDENGFMHPEFNSARAANGRLASNHPNSQNVPIEFRELWIADTPEHVIIKSDWNQVELRNAICIAADEYGLELLAKGIDFHIATAAEGYGLQLDAVGEDDRHNAKFIVYGLIYGRGNKDIALQLSKPVPWVDGFVGRYWRRFHGLWDQRQLEEKFVEKHGFLRNPFNRRRWWYGP